MSTTRENIEICRPFGPFIGKFKLPEPLIKDVNGFVDDVNSDIKIIEALDWSQNLVGKVHQELKIPDDILRPYELFLQKQARGYLKSILAKGAVSLNLHSWDIERRDAWVVRSSAGDFNPAHVHIDASICMAGFIKTPEWDKELTEDASDHAPSRGKLCFMHGNTQEWGNNLFYAEPVIGECYVFPSTLTHLVYPFSSIGERRSFSINFAKISHKDTKE